MLFATAEGWQPAKDFNYPRVVAFLILLCFGVWFLETELIVSTICGALLYGMMQCRMDKDNPNNDSCTESMSKLQNNVGFRTLPKSFQPQIATPGCYTPGSKQVPPPSFAAKGWNNQVKELLTRLMPTAAGQQAVAQIRDTVQRAIQNVIPEVEVSAFACGDSFERGAFGVAVPEVDVVLQCAPGTLLMRLQSQLPARNGRCFEKISHHKIRKSAVRVCTEMLLNDGFRFRRSAFRGADPEVTLLAPANLCGSDRSIPVALSVNNPIALRNAGLMAAAAALDIRALQVALLVRRWAKDRGVCHASKGHLPPYVWNVLTIFFLQARNEEYAVLPPMNHFDWSVCPRGLRPPPECDDKQHKRWKVQHPERDTAASLLKEFFVFYWSTVDWETEVVSLQSGQRGPIPEGMEVHEAREGEAEIHKKHSSVGQKEKILTVVDPWEPLQNLAAQVSYIGICRMKEELGRAFELCKQDASLSQLLEPWIPQEVENGEQYDR